MMERRRCANPTRRSLENQRPAPSGPRAVIWSRIRSSSASSTGGAEDELAKQAAMPHIGGRNGARQGGSGPAVSYGDSDFAGTFPISAKLARRACQFREAFSHPSAANSASMKNTFGAMVFGDAVIPRTTR